MVNPYPTGTFTLQDAPSFAWRSNVAVSEAGAFDIVSPADKATNNAIVDHTMKAALRGAITVLMNKPDADPKAGKGDNLVVR